jgi:phage-related protein (TIGR01555 family)
MKVENRYDSMYERNTGRGTQRDKIENLKPNTRKQTTYEARAWYKSNGFIQNIVDGPAEDATREWITIKTNRDHDNPETGLKGLGISRLIEQRLEELKARERIKDLIRYSRMYSDGGFMYFGIKSDVPQTSDTLVEPLPNTIRKLSYINVFGPDYASFYHFAHNPLSKYYHQKHYFISGVRVHESRIYHMIRNYLREESTGISVIETIIDAIKAQDTALWSVTSLIFEMAVWVFKSPDVRDMPADKLADLLANIRAIISTQSSIGIAEDEEFERISGTEAGKGFVKDIFDFIFENLSGLSRIPKSRLMGQSQGVITSGQYDIMSYYDSIAKFMELEVRFILLKIIDMIVHETGGKIYGLLGDHAKQLDWDFEFNPLWRLNPKDESDIDFRKSQKMQLDITSGIVSPQEGRSILYKGLEEFVDWNEGHPLAFGDPERDRPDTPGVDDDIEL